MDRERMLLPPINCVGNDVAHSLAQHKFLRHAANLHADRLLADAFHNEVVEEWNATFDGVPHLHSIAQHGEDVSREDRLVPQIQ